MRGGAVAAGVCVCCVVRGSHPLFKRKKCQATLVKHPLVKLSKPKHHVGHVQARVLNGCLGIRSIRTPLLRRRYMVIQDALVSTTFLRLRKGMSLPL
jgi:hypothetical protein